jgi:hypothetical protein
MLGKVHIAGYCLAIGALGQRVLYKGVFPHFPEWIVWTVLFLPWLTVYTISFFKRPPVSPQRFRQCLVFAMCWYAGATLLVEILHMVVHPSPSEHFPNSVARLLAYGGALSFIVFIQACAFLRHYETTHRT